MNERIRELAEQAGYYLYDLTETHEIKTVETDEKDAWITLEKFAELIVRECANHCDLLLDHKMSSEWSRGTHDCSKAIKKHFGVEE
jgi:hypothetical protein